MKKKEMINKMIGRAVTVDYDWLKNNDPDLLDGLLESKYWNRGIEKEIPQNEIIVRIEFDEGGTRYYATFESHPDGVRQSLANQEPWFEDSWEDWELHEIELYNKELI